jgi:hypothetical protein
MEIYRAVLDRAKLAAMPENERTLLLLLGHASNEINVLSKLILMMRKDDPPSLVFDHVEAGQTFILIRLLIGKLHEAWELFRTRVQSDPAISKTYLPQLTPGANAALQALKRHFGQGSVLTAVRNKVAFHYSDKEGLTEASFQALPPGEPLQFYLSKTVGNTFYHASELVVQLSAISLMPVPPAAPGDTASAESRAFAALCGEIITVSGHMTELFGEMIGLLGEPAIDNAPAERLSELPKLSAFTLPYFFEEADALPQPAAVPAVP